MGGERCAGGELVPAGGDDGGHVDGRHPLRLQDAEGGQAPGLAEAAVKDDVPPGWGAHRPADVEDDLVVVDPLRLRAPRAECLQEQLLLDPDPRPRRRRG